MTANNGHPSPTTRPHDHPVCGRCPSCHPGKQWGGDENCRYHGCRCHRRVP